MTGRGSSKRKRTAEHRDEKRQQKFGVCITKLQTTDVAVASHMKEASSWQGMDLARTSHSHDVKAQRIIVNATVATATALSRQQLRSCGSGSECTVRQGNCCEHGERRELRVECFQIISVSILHSRRPSLSHSFTPGLKCTCFTYPSHLSVSFSLLLLPLRTRLGPALRSCFQLKLLLFETQ